MNSIAIYSIYPNNSLIEMVKLGSWTDVNKSLFRRHLPQVISATEMRIFRMFESVFSGVNKDGEVHQCYCGNLFYLGKKMKKSVPKDWLGNPVCPKCGKNPEAYEDQEARRRFATFVAITQALRKFEESEPTEKMNHLKEVKLLAKNSFNFKTISEMYIGYYNLLSKMKKEDEVAPNLKGDWKALIDSMFEKAKSDNLGEFINFIFSPNPFEIRQIRDTIREAQTAIVRMEKDYFLFKVTDYPVLLFPVTKESVQESRIRFSLLLYNHLIELSPIYDLTMNLIEVSKGNAFSKEPFEKSIKYPIQKIRIINGANKKIGAIFNEFWIRQVRNAFAHSKYKIEGDFFFKTDEDFKIAIDELQHKINICRDYWNFLEHKVAKEQIFAQEKKILHTKNGTTIKISSDLIPDKL